MKIMLAPMEGVIDHHMRAILTGVGGYQSCVTEFVRVVDKLLPDEVFYRLCPELKQGSKTPAGTPVIVQLLGGIPEVVAMNAQRAVELVAPGIDINFGCPSKFVNRKAGGAVLLKEPQRVHDILHAVRKTVPDNLPVSAKIRLGYEDTKLTLDNARAVEDAGASFITVHARTKNDGYAAPARWEWLAHIKNTLAIPVIANGDINSPEDYRRCREISGCDDIMLGRGAVARPDLANAIQLPEQSPLPWAGVIELLYQLLLSMKQQAGSNEPRIVGRIKQWMALLKRHYAKGIDSFEAIRQLKKLNELEVWLTTEAKK